MQVGMNPTTLGAFVPLGRFVCSRPIALRVPPQSSECECESGWRFGCGEGLAKIFDGHFECRRPHVRMVSLKQIINLPRPPRPPLNRSGDLQYADTPSNLVRWAAGVPIA